MSSHVREQHLWILREHLPVKVSSALRRHPQMLRGGVAGRGGAGGSEMLPTSRTSCSCGCCCMLTCADFIRFISRAPISHVSHVHVHAVHVSELG